MLESTFYPHVRKPVVVDDYRQLKNKGNEARKKLNLSVPLGEHLVGMPGWVGSAYEQLAQQDGHVERVQLDVEMKSMSIQFFATDAVTSHNLLLTGCTLGKFAAWRAGLEEKARFWLAFVVYTPDSAQLHDWLREHFRMTTFALFEPQQGELAEVDAEFEEDDEAEQQPSLYASPAEEMEAARREACDPKHDAEFAGIMPLESGRPEPGRSTKLVTLSGGRGGGKTAKAKKTAVIQ